MRIQELEHQTGLDRASIRFYEREGLIAPRRSENGYRDYSEEDRDSLMKIRLLRQLGISLSSIRELQKGSVSFPEILSDRLNGLADEMETNLRSRSICRQLMEDGADYLV